MSLLLANIFGWCVAHWKTALTMLGLALVLLWASLHYLCGESRLDKKIDQQTGVIVGGDVGTIDAQSDANRAAVNANQIAANANAAESHSNQIETEANKLRNSNVSNVPLSKAMQDMCRAYPETQGCPK